MPGRTSWLKKKTALALMPSMRSQSASLISNGSTTCMIPALLTSTSTGPSWRAAGGAARGPPPGGRADGAADRGGPAPGRAALAGGALGVLGPQVAHADVRAGPGEVERDRAPDPPRPAGDQRALAGQQSLDRQ